MTLNARKWKWTAALLALAVCLNVAPGLHAADTEAADAEPVAAMLNPDEVLLKKVPNGIEELRLIETQVKALVKKVVPCVVAVQIGPGWGSGVIINEEGFVLTAGHVSGEPGKKVTFVFPDGKKAKGVSLGRNNRIDSGMFRITDDGPWPHCEMAKTGDLPPGTWCVSIGHPGGFDAERPYVVRLGRIIRANLNVIQSDCTLVGGDSGGPLFDMEGKVIGIHSRISGSTSANFHVPIDTYHDTWDRLAKGEDWGGRLGGPVQRKGAYLGVRYANHADGVLVTGVIHESPAHKAGIKPGDVIVRFNDETFKGGDQFYRLIGPLEPGTEVIIIVRRGDSEFSVKVTLADGRNP
jgi:serine protease Do